MARYQDVWEDGELVKEGERDCEGRYELIRPVLERIDPAFTALDLGAYTGYFSQRIAEDFPGATITAVDPHPDLPDIACDQIRVINKKVTAKHDLLHMERHDVVLALSVLHHFKNWRLALQHIRACRGWAIIEVPNPNETWMRSAASRDQLHEIFDAVSTVSTRVLGSSLRVGRNGKDYLRPLFLVPGTVIQVTGKVFTGSGSNSRIMPRFSKGLDKQLGYQPFPGSLNLRLGHELTWGEPAVDWVGKSGSRKRDYQMWRAWVGGAHLHAMQPGNRGHGANTMEMLAPQQLRKQFRLKDGDLLPVDVEPTQKLQRLSKHDRKYVMWSYPGKITSSMEAGKAYEQPLLEHIYQEGFTGLAVDVGANLGNHTLWMAKICDLQVMAFEPIKFPELMRNVMANELYNQVRIRTVALGAKTAIAQHLSKGRLQVGQGMIPVVDLDCYQLQNVSLIKIDVEGMEAQVLEGAIETIQSSKPVIFAEAWNEKKSAEIEAVIGLLGYQKTKQFGTKTLVERWDPCDH